MFLGQATEPLLSAIMFRYIDLQTGYYLWALLLLIWRHVRCLIFMIAFPCVYYT